MTDPTPIEIRQPLVDGPLEERLGGGGPMMEFDPDSDVQDALRAAREKKP